MKKTYAKPGLESRTFAQFENVFTACTKSTNNPKHGCTYCGEWNPGVDVQATCPVCGMTEPDHSRHAGDGGS